MEEQKQAAKKRKYKESDYPKWLKITGIIVGILALILFAANWAPQIFKSHPGYAMTAEEKRIAAINRAAADQSVKNLEQGFILGKVAENLDSKIAKGSDLKLFSLERSSLIDTKGYGAIFVEYSADIECKFSDIWVKSVTANVKLSVGSIKIGNIAFINYSEEKFSANEVLGISNSIAKLIENDILCNFNLKSAEAKEAYVHVESALKKLSVDFSDINLYFEEDFSEQTTAKATESTQNQTVPTTDF